MFSNSFSILSIIGILTVGSYLFFGFKSLGTWVYLWLTYKPAPKIIEPDPVIVLNKLVKIPPINARLFRVRTLN